MPLNPGPQIQLPGAHALCVYQKDFQFYMRDRIRDKGLVEQEPPIIAKGNF